MNSLSLSPSIQALMGEGDICIFYSLVCYIWQEHNWHIMGSQKIFVEGILVIKCLRLYAPNAWGLGSIPGHGYQAMKITSVQFSSVTQSCPTLCNPMDCSLSDSSIHGIFQAGVLEWGAIAFSRGSSQPRNEPGSPSLQADALLSEPPGRNRR